MVVVFTLQGDVPLTLVESGSLQPGVIRFEVQQGTSLPVQVKRELEAKFSLDIAAIKGFHPWATLENDPAWLELCFYCTTRSTFYNSSEHTWIRLYELLPREDTRGKGDEVFDPLETEERLLDDQPSPENPNPDLRLIAKALAQFRYDIAESLQIAELLPRSFTLSHLQQAFEAIEGIRLHTQNFRRLLMDSGIVEPTGLTVAQAAGRPAILYRYASGNSYRRRVRLPRRIPH